MKKKFCFLIFIFFAFESYSKIYVNIGAPEKIKKSLIALSSFVLKDSSPSSYRNSKGKQMSDRLRENLKFSAYFHVLSPQAFLEDPSKKSSVPYPKDPNGFRWKNWKLVGADFLFFADYSFQENQIVLDVSFHNVQLRKTVFTKQYKGQARYTDKMIDKLSNDIVKNLSGKKGIFETKILSIRNTSGSKKELFVMDWNGRNKKRLSYHRSIVLSPAWSNDGKEVAYSAFVYSKKFRKRIVALFLYNFKKHTIRLLSDKNGANLGSSFLPNGKEMLVTLSSGKGLLDIFKFHLTSRVLVSITKGPRGIINVEPNIHPRTKKIVFSSDRGGKTMIYTVDANGEGLKQISFAGNHNSHPTWHPEKREIVFSGLSKGRMNLFKISSHGTGLRRLTNLRKKNGRWANCESPSFSPDGRYLVFSSNVSGTYQLYVMNLDDLSIERITFDRYNYKSPKWSPYI